MNDTETTAELLYLLAADAAETPGRRGWAHACGRGGPAGPAAAGSHCRLARGAATRPGRAGPRGAGARQLSDAGDTRIPLGVSPDIDREEVARLIVEHDLLAMPVVDAANRVPVTLAAALPREALL